MNRAARFASLLLLTLLLPLVALPAFAQNTEGGDVTSEVDVTDVPEYPWGLSDFEWRLVQKTLEKYDLKLLERGAAEGKIIEEIIVETEEVFTEEDLWPDWLNVFHFLSRKHVVRREALLDVGEPYEQILIDQTARNMRGGSVVLSVALALPVEGSSPDKVKLLMITKDLWTLRTGTSFLIVGDTLSFLAVSLTENNFLGLQKQLAITSLLELDTFRLGQRYIDRRLLGSRLALLENFSIILNRDTQKYEGFAGALTVGLPLYSLRSKWGWEASVTGITEIGRFFQGASLAKFDNPNTEGIEEQLPYVWRSRFLQTEGSVTRSFGLKVKQNVSLGYSLSIERFEFGEDDAQRARSDLPTVEEFENTVLPRSEVISAPSITYNMFTPDFVPLRNFNTFALPEDFRFGPSISTSLRHSDPAFGSTSRFQGFSSSITYRWLFGDREGVPSRNGDVLSLSFGYDTRFQDGEFQDNEITTVIRNYSPIFFSGRLVFKALSIYRFQDRSNQQSGIGGDTGLRGYESVQFLGRSRVGTNLEWRTLPFELYTFHFGLVMFYDTGGVSDDEVLKRSTLLYLPGLGYQGLNPNSNHFPVYHTTGIGFRFLNPSSNRVVFRGDWGFPLNPPTGLSTLPGVGTFGFEQAF